MKNRITSVVILLFVLSIFATACSGGNMSNNNMNINSTTEDNSQINNDNNQSEATSTPEEVVATQEEATTPMEVSFESDVLPIMISACNQCHGTSNIKAGLSVVSYSGLMSGANNGEIVIAGNAEASKLVMLVASGAMPKSGVQLNLEQIEVISDWIDQGALDN